MPFSPTVSSIELSVMNTVKPFLDQMASEGATKKSSTPEYGNKILAEAIARGISTALVDPVIQTALSIIVDTNAAVVTPISSTSFSVLSAAIRTKSIPNPNLKP